MSKTVSARIEKERHLQLVERCNKIGCTINDYLNGAIELALNGSTQADLGDGIDDDSEQFQEVKSEAKIQENTHEIKEIPKAKNVRVSYDGGKTWINV